MSTKYNNVDLSKDQLLDIISFMIGEYNIDHLVSWYTFASSVGYIKRNVYEGTDCILAYYAEKNIYMRLFPSQGTHLHIWSRGSYDMKFRFMSDYVDAMTQSDYHKAIEYFEKKCDEYSDEKDPILEGLDFTIKCEL
jgi:hypothetical protein